MKKILSLLSLCLIVTLVSFSTLNDKKVIVIDAGHGGHDHGAKLDNLTEKEIVVKIANKIYEYNDQSTLEIVLLRDSDEFVSLAERVSKINEINPDLVISLHINSNTIKDKSGTEAYVSHKNTKYHEIAKEKAEKLLHAISNDNLKSIGVKSANFMLLKNVNCPSVLLELGYISNENDRKYITSEQGQNEIAANIIKSLQ